MFKRFKKSRIIDPKDVFKPGEDSIVQLARLIAAASDGPVDSKVEKIIAERGKPTHFVA